jgi:hypothetical protein
MLQGLKWHGADLPPAACTEKIIMRFPATSRRLLPLAVAVLLACWAAPSGWGQHPFRLAHQNGGRQQARQEARPSMRLGQGQGPRRNQEHLEQWMQQHSNMSLADQQKALDNEPGFRSLPPETQQRFHNRLAQLNSMPPARRQRLLEQNEAMERLTPPERKQVRSALQQLGAMPEDRRRLVSRAFRDLREMPPPQRQAILNSDRFRGQFSDQERSSLSNLLRLEPYLPVEHPNGQQMQGK